MFLANRDVLFILPTYNHFDYAKLCYESFIRYTPANSYMIALIDDASPDFDLNTIHQWTSSTTVISRFSTNGGLTRSWNYGLRLARAYDFKYAICGNSDILFTEGWLDPMKEALEHFALVGPITNAPGHAPWQDIRVFNWTTIDDDPLKLEIIARSSRDYYSRGIPCRYVNGFCMMAKTETWWKGAYDEEHVFNPDPKYKMLGNEDELQKRWFTHGLKSGYVPRTFIFHYRSVSHSSLRANAPNTGAFRNERLGWNDRIQEDGNGKLVDASMAESKQTS